MDISEISLYGHYQLMSIDELKMKFKEEVDKTIYGISHNMWKLISTQDITVIKIADTVVAQTNQGQFYIPVKYMRPLSDYSSIAEDIMTNNLSLRQAAARYKMSHSKLACTLKEMLALYDKKTYRKFKEYLSKRNKHNK